MPTPPRNRSQRGYLVCLTLGLLTPGLPSGASAAESQEGWVSMTLEQARTEALKHSPQIAQATGAIRTAQAAEKSAFGAYLPTLGVNASSSLASTERINPDTGTPVTGSSDSYTAGLSANWDVFTGFRRRSEKRQAEANTQAAEAQLVEDRFGVALSVERAFFDGLRAEELMAVAQARIKRAEEGVEAAERRLAVGSATRSDLLRSQLELNTARESMLQLESDRYSAGLTLGRLVGIQGPVDPVPAGPSDPAPLSVSGEALVESLVSAAPSVRAAEAAVASAEAGIGVARSQYFPSVRLSAGYDWFNDTPLPSGGRTSWSVRLGLSYPIFDAFQRDEGEVRARTQAEIAQSQLADTRRAVRSEAERVLSLLRLAEQRIELARYAVQVAQEDLRVQQERYRLGVTTILDLLTSQSALVEAENKLVGLRFDYQLSRAELESIAGRAL
jgi:outer membrane protein